LRLARFARRSSPARRRFTRDKHFHAGTRHIHQDGLLSQERDIDATAAKHELIQKIEIQQLLWELVR
jgi:hypothetical protein